MGFAKVKPFPYFSLEEYLRYEREAEERSELIDGEHLLDGWRKRRARGYFDQFSRFSRRSVARGKLPCANEGRESKKRFVQRKGR